MTDFAEQRTNRTNRSCASAVAALEAAKLKSGRMIETALGLGLIDRLIQLVKVREDRDEKRFKELAQKLFADLELIHTDYLLFIESARQSLENGVERQEILSKFEMDRLQREPLRRRTVQLINEARSQEKFKSMDAFLHASARYFTTTTAQSEVGQGNTLSRVMETILEGLAESGRAKALAGFKMYLFALRYDWDVLSKEYARLLTKSL